jgi:hypothetical protein
MGGIKYMVKQAYISESIEMLENKCGPAVEDRGIRFSGVWLQVLYSVRTISATKGSNFE